MIKIAKTSAFLYAAIASTIALLLHIKTIHFIERSLWAEDGNLFLNQALSLGTDSFFTSYAGYLHFYPRMISLLAIQLPPLFIPYILLLGWFLAFIFLIWTVIRIGNRFNIPPVLLIFLSVFIALVPSSQEIYFNLANGQWYLGAAFFLYFCTPNLPRPSLSELLIIMILSLTGPFSLIILPVLALRRFLSRDFQTMKWAYIVVGVCGLFQLAVIFTLPKMAIENGFHINLYEVLTVLKLFLLFGAEKVFVVIAALLFWCLFAFCLANVLLKKHDKNISLLIIYTLFSCATFMGTVILMSRDFLSDIHPLGGCSRYFFIPYVLIFFAAISLIYKQKWQRAMMITLIAIICVGTLSKVERANLQWNAFSKWSEINSNLIIPIAPYIKEHPGRHVNPGKYFLTGERPHSYSLNTSKIKLTYDENSTSFYLSITDHCIENRYIGLEINVWRKNEGEISVSWGENTHFNKDDFLARYYPSGESTIQLAFFREIKENDLKITSMGTDNPIKIKNILLYCLD